MTDTYHRSCLQSTRFEPVRECRVLASLSFDSGMGAVHTELDLPVVGQDVDRSDITRVIPAARPEGVTVDPVSGFPCLVFIAVPVEGRERLSSPIRSDDLEITGRGELYRTRPDAQHHSFG